MKVILIVIMLFSFSFVYSTTFYFSDSGDDNNTCTVSKQPGKSLIKLQKMLDNNIIKQGDSILFKRGSSFFGTLTITISNLYFGAYGEGEKPIITGYDLKTTPWEKYSQNIYSKKIAASNIHFLQINGLNYQKGRFPDEGWSTIASGGSQTYFVDNNLEPKSQDFWTGAEVCMRTQKWAMSVRTVSNQDSDGTISWIKNTEYASQKDNGFFFQNHLKCLTNHGDWAIIDSQLFVYINGDSKDFEIRASAKDNGLMIYSQSLVIDNLSIIGFNEAGISLFNQSRNITVKQCDFVSCITGVYSFGSDKLNIVKNKFVNLGKFGTEIWRSDFSNIAENSFENIGTIPGIIDEQYGDGLQAIRILETDSITITKNNIQNVGYNGISGSKVNRMYVDKNIIKNYCLLKDDGAGIYFWHCDPKYIDNYKGNYCRNNFIEGNPDASSCLKSSNFSYYTSVGIYIDDVCQNIQIKDNIAVNNLFNILIHQSGNIDVIGNYTAKSNSRYTRTSAELSMLFYEDINKVENCKIVDNSFITNYSAEYLTDSYPLMVRNIENNNLFTNNHYLMPTGSKSGEADIVHVTDPVKGVSTMNLAEWKASYGGETDKIDIIRWDDSLSTQMNKSDFVVYQYNFSDTTVAFNFTDNYLYYDVNGNVLDKYYLKPYTGAVLLRAFKYGKVYSSNAKPTEFVKYIDPENNNDPDEDGSIEHPFDSWNDIKWVDNYQYLQKRGTIANEGKIALLANNIILGSYNYGEKPVINSSSDSYTIQLSDNQEITIEDLEINAPNAEANIYIPGKSNTIIVINNCITNGADVGILAIGSGNLKIQKCEFRNRRSGISSSFENTEIFYNIFKENQVALELSNTQTIGKVYNNVFYNNDLGISSLCVKLISYNNIFNFKDTGDKAVRHNQLNTFISDNNIYYPDFEDIIDIIGNQDYNLIDLQENGKSDVHSFIAYPMFEDQSNNDFRIKSSSPAIDRGKNVGLEQDFNGNAVPLGNYPDIGVAEIKNSLLNSDLVTVTEQQEDLLVFPNPSTGSINYQVTNDASYVSSFRLYVKDSYGKTIYERNIESPVNNNSNSLDLSFLAKGLYFLILSSGSKVLTKKLILY